ncbi:MAG: tetratricopeptide repeat protein [Alphaproteobacteria bacterium]
MSDDSIFREVDEAVRHDQFKALWDKYGIIAMSGAVMIVAGVGGYKFWNYWQAEQAAKNGARFIGGITLLEDKKTGEAVEVFKSLSTDAPSGYRILARFQLAAVYAKDGRDAEAVKLYEELAANSSVNDVQQGFANIQAATLRVDEAPFDEMLKRLEGLAVTGNPWRHSARELLGLSAYRTGDMTVAERYFNVMLADQQTPQNMRRRAEMMLSLLVQTSSAAPPAGK